MKPHPRQHGPAAFPHDPRHAIATLLAWTMLFAFLLAGIPAQRVSGPAEAAAWSAHGHGGGEECAAGEEAPAKPRRHAPLRVSTANVPLPPPPAIATLPVPASRPPASPPPSATASTPPPRTAPGLRQQRGQAPPLA